MSLALTLWFIYVPLLLALVLAHEKGGQHMIAGHYATALVPYELTRKTQHTSFWVFLVAAQFLDLAMLVFVSLGIEQLLPKNFLDFAFASSSSNMWVTHDILPALGWSVAIGLLFWAFTRKRVVAIWCGVLVFVHEIFDLLVGYTHYWTAKTRCPLD